MVDHKVVKPTSPLLKLETPNFVGLISNGAYAVKLGKIRKCNTQKSVSIPLQFLDPHKKKNNCRLCLNFFPGITSTHSVGKSLNMSHFTKLSARISDLCKIVGEIA